MDTEKLAKDRADWLLDAVAGATQNRQFLRGDPEYDEVSGEAILLNGEKAIRVALEKQAEILNLFRSAAFRVSTDINPAGYEWCMAYLDQALVAAGGPK